MCGRYTIFTDEDEREVLEIIRIVNERYRGGDAVYKTGEIFPSDRVPLLVAGKKDGMNAVLSNWGFTLGARPPVRGVLAADTANSIANTADSVATPAGKGVRGSAPRLVINARSETAVEKPLFRDSFLWRRCVVPSTGFYEWGDGKEKRKYHFRLPGGGALYMAGIWRPWEDGGQFLILTAPANPSVAEIHHRMPVIIGRESFRDWFGGGAAALMAGEMPALDRSEAV